MELPVKPENAKKVIDLLYDEPIINRNKMSEITGIKLTTINGIVNALIDKDIITETTGYSRNQIFAFEKYINLFLRSSKMLKSSMEETRKILADDMQKYVQLILKDYESVIPKGRQEFLREIDNYYPRIIVEDNGTISMFATNDGIIMPKGAYEIFKYMKLIPGYGINKKHKSYKEGEILNKKTYYDYIKHVFVTGMNVEEFFRDTLLHETMHFCGSDGGSALREGLTELKTREFAQKYNLIASRCGYPKEVEIASRLQKIIGEDVTNKITFAQSNKEIYNILQENCEKNVADLFFEISYLMDKELNSKYNHSMFGGILGPIKKARAYSKIDYSEVHKKLKEFEEHFFSSIDGKKGQFIGELKKYEITQHIQTNDTKYEEQKDNGNGEKDISL